MKEIEKKREEEIDSKMSVNIDLQKGTTDLNRNEEDKLFTFGNQVLQTNEYLQNTTGSSKKAGGKYRPFEGVEMTNSDLINDPESAISSLNSFYFKPCTLGDEKSQKLYQDLKPNYMKEV